MCEEALMRTLDNNDTSFSVDCPESDMISLSESRSSDNDSIDGESLTSEDWEELRDGEMAMAFHSRTMSDEISIEIPCSTLLNIRNDAADLSSNSSMGSSLSMDCDDDDDALYFSERKNNRRLDDSFEIILTNVSLLHIGNRSMTLPGHDA
jgi:hypothetical protein